MSKTIYYLGAGASYVKRDEQGAIIEGVPVVAEIPMEFAAFRKYIADTEIPTGYIQFQGIYQMTPEDVIREKQAMLADIDDLQNGIQEHATIDTYARKLYLTRRFNDFKKLKDVLCSFFVWTQLEHKVDGRYDTFLANVLEENTLLLPQDISIISWNYDSQIEKAYKAYGYNQGLIVYEKNIQGEWPPILKSGRVFKINGSATFYDMSVIDIIKESENETAAALQLIIFYNMSKADTSSLGFQLTTHLSFAWEDSHNQQNLIETINTTVNDAQQVVVIGYSFPFFNRNTDRYIFSQMPQLRKVYIQDKNPDAVKQSIEAVFPVGNKIQIIPISDCTQFYLPSEL